MSDELNLPWKIYFFDSEGFYDKNQIVTITSEEDINSPFIGYRIREHNNKKLEVRVCDALDVCILHCKDGEKIWPK